MPFNLQILRTRALTALAFVIVMFAGLLWNKWGFILLFSIIHFGCWYEFVKLMKKIYTDDYLKKCVLGLLYITMPVFMMLDLGITLSVATDVEINDAAFMMRYSPVIPCGIIFSFWINDTMAYIVGSLIGRTSFSKISPKKTWEGTLGGIILCIVVVGLFGKIIPAAKIVTVNNWIAIASICAICGTGGDLLESKLKRMAAVKDSGSILPGHGGFLDRFDSFLIATPFVWIYVELFLS